MNILTAYYGSHERGCWKRLYSLISELVKDGYKLTIITSHEVETFKSVASIENIVLKPFGDNRIGLLFFIIRVAVYSLLFLLKKKYNCIIAFDCQNATPFIPLSRLTKIPILLFIRGVYKYQDLFNTSNKIMHKLMHAINYYGYKSACHIVYNSQESKAILTSDFGPTSQPIEVIYNNIPSIASAGKPISIFKKNTIIIGYLGQLVPRKNIEFLIKAIHISKNADLRLLIKGNGPSKEALIQYTNDLDLSNKIKFVNWSNEVSSFFATIDIFVLPSFFDDASNALLEAIGYEKIVFASNSGGNSEILGNKSDLLFCPYSGVEKLSKQLEHVASNPQYAKEIKKHLLSRKKELTFDWSYRIKEVLIQKSIP